MTHVRVIPPPKPISRKDLVETLPLKVGRDDMIKKILQRFYWTETGILTEKIDIKPMFNLGKVEDEKLTVHI